MDAALADVCLPIIPQYHRVGENDYVQRTDMALKLTKCQFINLYKLKRKKRKLKFMTEEVRIYGARMLKKNTKNKTRKATPFSTGKYVQKSNSISESILSPNLLGNVDPKPAATAAAAAEPLPASVYTSQLSYFT